MGFYREALFGLLFIFSIIFIFSVFSTVLSAIYPDIIEPSLQNEFTAPLVSLFLTLWNRTPVVLVVGSLIAIIVAAFYAERQERRVM